MPAHEESAKSARYAVNSALAGGYEAKLFDAFTPATSPDFQRMHNIHLRSGLPIHSGGALGCFASHYALWLKCYELGEPIVILEHDAKVINPWPFPTWKHILHFNCNGSAVRRCSAYWGCQADRIAPVRPNSIYKMLFSPGDWPSLICMSTTFAYAITPEASALLIEDAKSNGFFFVDRFIREPLVEIHTISPALAVEQEIAHILTTT